MLEPNTLLHQTESFLSQKGLVILEYLLQKGANPNVKNIMSFTPVHQIALCYGDPHPLIEQVAELLCKYGGDLSIRDRMQETPLCKFQN